MSIKYQPVMLFNIRETKELTAMLTAKDVTTQLLALNILVTTNKRFHKKDAGRMVIIITKLGWSVCDSRQVYQRINYPNGAVSYHLPDPDPNELTHEEKELVRADIARAILMHKQGWQTYKAEQSKYRKKEYRRSAKNHWS